MAKGSLQIVRDILQEYADRGIFRGFAENRSGQFQFVWLHQHQMHLRADTAMHTLRFAGLFPAITARSQMYAELKRYIQERHDRAVPEHRRVDRRRAEVTCSNRNASVSIILTVKNRQYAYGVKKIVNLVHDIFLHLRDVYPEYLMENFDVPQE